MQFTVDRVIRLDSSGSLRAFCDLNVGGLIVIKGVRVVDGKNGLFVSMPRQKSKDERWYDSVRTVTPEVKQQIETVVLEAYENAR